MSDERNRSVERKRRVFELLDQALERPARDRPAFLDQACSDDDALRLELESLLDTEVDDGGLLAEPAFSVHAEDAGVGRRIGRYQLVRLLDRGGMGSVYLAEREDFEQRVALKLIRRGLDADEILVRRFQNERQILARLVHPHIARLLDGGATEDLLPYFVMEYVEGEPIDRYCEARGLPIGERLGIFRKVCSAVQFAHQNLVIHRDLKPGNILITAGGEPKLLDFGIAKLLDQGLAAQTLTTIPGQGPMTPRYASPEQIRLEPVTTASDVYSLGVLLYELLTGLDPYCVDSGRGDEIARAICEREPDKPSTAVRRRAPEADAALSRNLRRRLAGDLDSIVLKAMRKEPRERYASAEQLSEDLRRHLAGLPVGAQTGHFTYRASKFVRRHRLGMAVAAAFLLLILGFSVATTVLWQQAERDRRAAQTAFKQAERDRRAVQTAFKFLKEMIGSADPDQAKGEKLTAIELLEGGKDKVAEELNDVPELQIDVAGMLGDVFRKLGAYDDSREMMETSLQVAREHYAGDHPEVATRLNNLAVLLYEHEDYSQAELRFREILEMRQRLDQKAPEHFKTKSNLAMTLLRRGNLEEAEVLCAEVLEARLELYKANPDDLDVATSRHNLAAVYYAQGVFEKAEPLLRKALATRQRRLGSRHTRVATVLDLLGSVLAAQGRVEEAEQTYDEALTMRRSLLKEEHRAVAKTKKNLAALLTPRDPARARVLVTEALEVFNRVRPDGWDAAEAESVLGMILTASGGYQEAEPYLTEGYRRMAGLRSSRTYRSRLALERILDLYQAWNKPEEFEQYRMMAEAASAASSTAITKGE